MNLKEFDNDKYDYYERGGYSDYRDTRVPEEEPYRKRRKKNKVFAVLGFSIASLAFLTVLFLLGQKPARTAVSKITEPKTPVQEETGIEEWVSGSTLTSDQLDFWKDFPKKEAEGTKTGEGTQAAAESGEDKNQVSGNQTEEEHKNETLIVMSDGSEKWVRINPYLIKNEFDYTGLVFKDPIMQYYENSEKRSLMGVDISKEQGNVDYNKLKKSGVQYVMLRVGARGYGNGQLTADDFFKKNIKGAADAGLSIGVYFYSQAITQEEALEEADFVLETLKDYVITYPIAYDMEEVKGDTARIDGLSQEERTQIAKTFLSAVSNAGYKTVIYGNKEWLLTKINLSLLTEYDIWLSQETVVPDYPYKFNMWQYSKNGIINGISGKAGLNISFIDYDLK